MKRSSVWWKEVKLWALLHWDRSLSLSRLLSNIKSNGYSRRCCHLNIVMTTCNSNRSILMVRSCKSQSVARAGSLGQQIWHRPDWASTLIRMITGPWSSLIESSKYWSAPAPAKRTICTLQPVSLLKRHPNEPFSGRPKRCSGLSS